MQVYFQRRESAIVRENESCVQVSNRAAVPCSRCRLQCMVVCYEQRQMGGQQRAKGRASAARPLSYMP